MGAFFRDVSYGAKLLPSAVAAIVAVIVRRPLAVTTGGPVTDADRRSPSSRARVLVAAILSALLGVVTLIPLGALVLFILRGVLYGVVDRGPYDTSWGGPTLAGAWLAHLAVGLLTVPFAIAALWLLGKLQRRLSDFLVGGGTGWWSLPVTVIVDAVAVLLLIGWLRQI